MANFSFDIESTLDKAELNNVFEQVKRDISNRYDFKDTPANIEWLEEAREGFKLTGNSETQLEAIIQLIRLSIGKRALSQKLLDLSSKSIESNLKVVKDLPFKQGLDSDKAKAVSKIIRDKYPKIKLSIQGQTVRVNSNSKDELQKVMTIVRAADLDYPVQFTNFR